MDIFKQKPYRSVEVNPYRFDFYYDENNIRKGILKGTYLRISVVREDEQWSLAMPGNSHAYGYLLAALNQGKTEQLANYARLMWCMSMLDTTEQGFDSDAWKVVLKWQKRMFKRAESNAKAVTEAEETASQAFMESVVKRSKMSRKEVKKEREELKKVLKEEE